MKKWDKIIIVILLIISFLPYAFVKFFMGGSSIYAEITIDGAFYKKIPLTGQMKHIEFEIETDYGYNKIAVQNESIAVVEANCKDGICEEFGYISRPGEVIVCLPHKLYIEVKGENSNIDIRTY